jgi:hypothetical protein
MAGAWRLARFPLLQSTDRFAGLPTPPSGLLLAVASLAMPAAALLALTLGLALLMVSTTPFPTLGRAVRFVSRSRATAPELAPATAGAAPVVLPGEPGDAEPRQRRRRRPALRVRVRVGRGGMVRVSRRARRLDAPRDELVTSSDARD